VAIDHMANAVQKPWNPVPVLALDFPDRDHEMLVRPDAGRFAEHSATQLARHAAKYMSYNRMRGAQGE
jgi:hypothetical protein